MSYAPPCIHKTCASGSRSVVVSDYSIRLDKIHCSWHSWGTVTWLSNSIVLMHPSKQQTVFSQIDWVFAPLHLCFPEYSVIILQCASYKSILQKQCTSWGFCKELYCFFMTYSLFLAELCLKESLCMGISSKLLLDATGTPSSELDSIYSLNDRGRLKREYICNTCYRY